MFPKLTIKLSHSHILNPQITKWNGLFNYENNMEITQQKTYISLDSLTMSLIAGSTDEIAESTD